MRRILLATSVVLALLGPIQAADGPPNFVIFLVDDMGWADISPNNPDTFYETPNIQRLAASGMRFTRGYAACPVCSPTRASIMTGRHPVRVDITDWIPGLSHKAKRKGRMPATKFKFLQIMDRDELALEEVTIAEVLKEAGYETFFAGKWHLGSEGFWPTDQGFDVNIGGHHVGSPPGGYYSPWRNPALEAKEDGEYLTERLTEESIDFLDKRDGSKPFLLYLSYYNVHTPIQPYLKHVERFEAKAARLPGETPTRPEHEDAESRLRQGDAAYASMVSAVDDSVGAMLAKLEALGIDENTHVIFFSDNGGLSTKPSFGPTSNEPLRAGKGWLYEGGVREPAIIRAPGVTEPGSVCETPIVSMDFFPTILDLAGLPLQTDLHADGRSLLPLLKGDEAPGRTLYWHYPHYHGSTWKPGASILEGDWKLIEFYHHEKVELYNLAEDPSEKTNLSQSNPEKTAELRQKLADWQKQMKARMPVPDPDHNG